MLNIFRWVLVVPAAVVAWCVAIVAGIFVSEWVDRMLCPPLSRESGFCTDHETNAYVGLIQMSFAGASAMLVVLAATITAPEMNVQVAWVTLVTGSLLALLIAFAGFSTYLLMSAVSAVGAGFVMASVVTYKIRHWAKAPSEEARFCSWQ